MNTAELRETFLTQGLMQPGVMSLHYSSFDRFIFGTAVPTIFPITLETDDALKAEHFLQRREMGVLNVGGNGVITVDGTDYKMERGDMLYIGMGAQQVVFKSSDRSAPAQYYINSAPAHQAYPTTRMTQSEANKVELGAQLNANKRTLYQYIHEGGVQSCQLVMGFTELSPGNIWNTFPPHTHDRRMEVYFYFDVPDDQVVMHFMGEPTETRHLVMRNFEAVVSPPWSIHAGAGSSAYRFVWGMAGENKAFADMDGVPYDTLK